MTGVITYSCTALNPGKKGTLKQLDGGYYLQPIGAFNVFNSSGIYYPFKDAAPLLAENAVLMRRIANGNCKGEVGHPKRLPGQSFVEYIARIAQIWEDNVCVNFRKIHIDQTGDWKDKDGRPMVAILGEFCPFGPKKAVIADAVADGFQNLNFSLRSYVNDVAMGSYMEKRTTKIFGWDYVNEPGIFIANKYMAPGLESMIDNIPITKELLDNVRRYATDNGFIGLENADNFDFTDVYKTLEGEGHSNIQPLYMTWK